VKREEARPNCGLVSAAAEVARGGDEESVALFFQLVRRRQLARTDVREKLIQLASHPRIRKSL
jgi:hypothetical protein